jgi:hypothetical protein
VVPAFIGAGASIAVAVLAGIGQRRRTHRSDLDRIGMVDWRSLQMAALMAAALCVSVAMNLR